MTKLTQNTTVTLGVVAFIVSASLWVGSIFFQTKANAQNIIDLQNENSVLIGIVTEIRLDVRELKVKIDDIHTFYEGDK